MAPNGSMNGDLKGQVAIVVGASAGIGRAYALALAGDGATVVAAARTLGDDDGGTPARNTLTEVVKTSEGLPGSVHAQVCDVTVESDVVATVERTATEFGRVDVLVNNAAIMTRYDPFATSGDDWERVMLVNVRGPYLAIREVTPHMMRQQSGSIVNITAAAANFIPKGHRAHGSLVYAVSKAALNRMSHFMAEELREHGIAVNALSPGIVLSDTAAAARPGLAASGEAKPATPEALGPALLFLARQRGDGLTGQVLHTDEFGKSWP
jgi:NAD(P)-dependent dehydrogenase (short-subunit alcohol dehydrogenase family)